MRRLLPLLAAAVLAGGFAGCNDRENSEQSNDGELSPTGTVETNPTSNQSTGPEESKTTP